MTGDASRPVGSAEAVQRAVSALAVGRHALLLETTDAATARSLYMEVLSLCRGGELQGVTDVVPGERTVLVDGLDRSQAVGLGARRWVLPALAETPSETVWLDVVYDGEDLEEVSGKWGMDLDAAIGLHAGALYTVAFSGFAPGFAYMLGLPERFSLPRRLTPRARVPAGAVGVAGSYTGIYPRATPGGWNLIGHTDAVLWSLDRDPPALLVPGTRVRLRAVG